jgi:hypothetical protein
MWHVLSCIEAPLCVREEAVRRATIALQKALSFYKRGVIPHRKDNKQFASRSTPAAIKSRELELARLSTQY